MDLNKQGIKNLEKIEDITLPVRRQPVRTTFRISKEAHDAIKHISKVFKIKNTEVFDSFLPNFQELKKQIKDLDMPSLSNIKGNATRKTYLINKSTLLNIEKVAKEEKISRDSFVDFMSLVLKLLCDKRLSKEKSKYEKVLEEIINPFWEHAEKIEKDIIKELGKDDPLRLGFGIVIINIMNLAMAITDNINEGKPIQMI
jgi:hypothetical protein